MDCRYCEIQVEITKRAYAARCPNPVAVLDYIREKMKGSTRPRIELADMKRVSPPLTVEEEMTISDEKQTKASEDDLLTTAAKAIGTTLGKIAVKAGIAKPPAPATKLRRKAAARKKTPAAKGSPRKSSRPGTAKKPQPKKKSK
jgi:hypothetical protein